MGPSWRLVDAVYTELTPRPPPASLSPRSRPAPISLTKGPHWPDSGRPATAPVSSLVVSPRSKARHGFATALRLSDEPSPRIRDFTDPVAIDVENDVLTPNGALDREQAKSEADRI